MRGEPETIRPRRDDESLVEYYLDETTRPLAEGTKNGYRYAWNRLEDWANDNGYTIGEMGKSEVEKMCEDWEQDSDIQEHVAYGYINKISRVVSWLVNNTNEANYNPYEDYEFYFDPGRDDGETSKLEVSTSELRELLQDVLQYRIEIFVYLFIALKTGMRSGEIINLDLRDIHLDHPISKSMPTPRIDILNHPDTIYVDSSISEGRSHNGEVRSCSNKPKSTRKIPIDEELKNVLVWWIGMLHTTTSQANPLLRKVTDPEGERISQPTVTRYVSEWARENEMNAPGMKHFGVDSHWCRHWFSTMLRARIDEGEVPIGTAKEYVQGLRGDSEDGVIATYTQEWEEAIEDDGKDYSEVYEDNIPQLLMNIDD